MLPSRMALLGKRPDGIHLENPAGSLYVMSSPPPTTYRTRNWASCNAALKRRGSWMIWCDPAMSWEAVGTGKRGRQLGYSDAAIQTCLTMKAVSETIRWIVSALNGRRPGTFGRALRQMTGFVEGPARA